MARRKKPTETELLDDLSRAAILRKEANRLYMSLFRQALLSGIRPSVIARHAHVSPQAVNSMKHRIGIHSADRNPPASLDEVIARAHRGPDQRRRNAS
ncbi:MAG: hypothetical protein PHQ28_00200 [Mycobacterium sp.]|nr:hypothetical protein [Mycobacterium sp.]